VEPILEAWAASADPPRLYPAGTWGPTAAIALIERAMDLLAMEQPMAIDLRFILSVIKINAEMEKLEPATKFGPEYLTYVMWAITPEGRATNVGEVLLNGGKSKLEVTTRTAAARVAVELKLV